MCPRPKYALHMRISNSRPSCHTNLLCMPCFLLVVDAFQDAILNSRFLKENTLTWPIVVVWPLLSRVEQQKKLAISTHLCLGGDKLDNELHQISLQANDRTKIYLFIFK